MGATAWSRLTIVVMMEPVGLPCTDGGFDGLCPAPCDSSRCL
jgi:hypothetical protein